MTEQTHHWLRTLVWVSVAGVIAWRLGDAIRESSATQGERIIAAVNRQGGVLKTAVVDAVNSAKAGIGSQITKVTDPLAVTVKAYGRLADVATQKVDAFDVPGAVAAVRDPLATTAEAITATTRDLHDERVFEKFGNAAASVSALGDALAPESAQITAGAVAAMKPIQTSAEQVSAALPDFVDCYRDGFGNPDCLQARWAESSRSITRIADAIDKWIERLTAPPSLKAQIKAWVQLILGLGARIGAGAL